MPRVRSELKVAASDALEFEAIQSTPSRSWRGGKIFILVIVFAVLVICGWLFFEDTYLRLTSRNGDIMPLITAPTGPVKVRPKKPGGLQVPNRDKLVYDRIQSGTVTPGSELVERLLPRSEKPLPKPVFRSRVLSEPPTKAKSRGFPHYPEATVPSVEDVKSVEPPPPLSVIPEIRSPSTHAESRSKEILLSQKNQILRDSQLITSPKQVIQGSPSLPKPSNKEKNANVSDRPEQNSVLVVPKIETSKAQSSVSTESYRVQLAAARTPERARSEWDRLRRKHLDLLGDFGLTITKADLGPKKGVFYRLRVGPFVNEVSARAFCKKLSKRKMGCLVIKPDR